MQVEKVLKSFLGLDVTWVCVTPCTPYPEGGQRRITSRFRSGSCLRISSLCLGLDNSCVEEQQDPFAGSCGWETEEVVGGSNSLITFLSWSPHLRRLFGHCFPYSYPPLKFSYHIYQISCLIGLSALHALKERFGPLTPVPTCVLLGAILLLFRRCDQNACWFRP